MSAMLDLRNKVIDYLEGKITLDGLNEYAAENFWDPVDPESEDLLGEIELAIAEFTNGHRTEAEVRDILAKATETVVIRMGNRPDPEIRTGTSATTVAV